MNNLIFSLNATMPVFLLMVFGYFLNRIGWMDDELAAKLNTFVFRIPLPVLLFHQLATTDFIKAWDTKFVLFCFFATFASILIVTLLSRLLIKQRDLQGEFIQASYRSSAALLGIAYISNLYGRATMAPLMIIGAVPLYNIMAVVVLSLTEPGAEKLNKAVLKKTILGIFKNPIIIGIVLGFFYSILNLPMGKIPDKFLSEVAALSTPLGLMAMGASVDVKKIGGQLKNAIVASFIKLVGLEIIFLPLAIKFGFRYDKLVAILIMLGSATTVSSYVMCRNMHHEGILTSNTVILTTILSAFTLTFWIFMLRTLHTI